MTCCVLQSSDGPAGSTEWVKPSPRGHRPRAPGILLLDAVCAPAARTRDGWTPGRDQPPSTRNDRSLQVLLELAMLLLRLPRRFHAFFSRSRRATSRFCQRRSGSESAVARHQRCCCGWKVVRTTGAVFARRRFGASSSASGAVFARRRLGAPSSTSSVRSAPSSDARVTSACTRKRLGGPPDRVCSAECGTLERFGNSTWRHD